MSLYGTLSPLPSRWETQIRETPGRLHPSLLLKVDGLTVRYIGPAEDNKQAAAVKADQCIPSDLPLFYFEMTVKNKGLEGFIGIGFQVGTVNLLRLPGWEPRSYGYHGDDGHAFSGSGQGRTYGEKFTVGDTIGALLDRMEKTISFYKNGVDLGVAFSNVQDPNLYPVIGLNTRGEEVTVNFGATPFVGASVPALLAAQRKRLITQIQGFPLPAQPRSIPGSRSENLDLLPSLVMQHLIHHRYSQTAKLLSGDLMNTTRTSSVGVGEASGTLAQQKDQQQQQQQQQQEDVLSQQEAEDVQMASSSAAGFDTEMLQPEVACSVGAAQGSRRAEDGPSRGLSDLVDRIAGIAIRQQVYDALVAGEVDKVLYLLETHYSLEVLRSNPHLEFGLKVLKFAGMIADNSSTPFRAPSPAAGTSPSASDVDMQATTDPSQIGFNPADWLDSDEETAAAVAPQVSSASGCVPTGGASRTEAALAFGRGVMSSVCSESEREVLEEVMSLFAYDDPWVSPAGYLLGAAHRVSLAEGLNGAILYWQGQAPHSSLERLGQQAAVLLEEAKRLGIPSTAGLNLQAMLFSPSTQSAP